MTYKIRFSLRTFLFLLTTFCAVLAIGSGKRPVRDCLVETNEQLHVAIVGEGYFRVVNVSGEGYYTRRGEFQLNKDGALVLKDSDILVEPHLVVPLDARRVLISRDGRVQTKDGSTGEFFDIGSLELFAFPDNKSLVLDRPTGLLKPVSGQVVAQPISMGMDQQSLLLQGWRSVENPRRPTGIWLYATVTGFAIVLLATSLRRSKVEKCAE